MDDLRGCLMFKAPGRTGNGSTGAWVTSGGTRPDYQVAKNWDNDRKSSINFYQPTFNWNSLGVANISGGTVVIGSKEEATSSDGKHAYNSTENCQEIRSITQRPDQ
ncbi:5009_t:CDS:2 [Ambispora gerdemannii]|uniref:5009_t:CDS:1 n=1 Tax=Ambispora gerdemannii TaxID=144530 RepID=A0A9N9C953_9GLOM|nr:5009_t:CDS:2 [Ambispora gerdemannii]